LIVEKHYDLTEVELARPAESSASAGGMGLRMFTRITLVASFLCSSFVLQSLGLSMAGFDDRATISLSCLILPSSEIRESNSRKKLGKRFFF